MAQRKFSDLVSATRINKADLLALEQTDGTKKATFAQLCTEIAVQEIAEQIEDFPEITEEDTLSVIVGKINKWQKDVIRKINDSAVDILDSKEEIEANTENGKVAGALAVKAMADELNGKITTTIISVRNVVDFDENLIVIQGGSAVRSGNVLTFYMSFTVSSSVTAGTIAMGKFYGQYFPAAASAPLLTLDGDMPYKTSEVSAWAEFNSKSLMLYAPRSVAGKHFFVYGTWLLNSL